MASITITVDGLTVDAVKTAEKCQNGDYNGNTAQELYEMDSELAAVRAAVDVLRRYCERQNDDCDGCRFFNRDKGPTESYCKLRAKIPDSWERP